MKQWDPVSAIAGYFPELPATAPAFGAQAFPSPRELPRDERTERRRAGHDGQYGYLVPSDGQKRCPQCWEVKAWPGAFDQKQNCNACRAKARVRP